MTTVCVTGVSGFLGTYIAQHYKRSGASVLGIGQGAIENAPMRSLDEYLQIKLPASEFSDVLTKHQPSILIHAAGRASVPHSFMDPGADFSGNTVLTYWILDKLRQHSPDTRFVLLSSAAVYGNPASLPIYETSKCQPISPYGFHKWQAELACQEFSLLHGIRTAVARIFSAYGPGLRRQVVWDLSSRIHTESALKVHGTGNESRDFIHARDVAKAVDAIAACEKMQGECYNVASGVEVTIAELTNLIVTANKVDMPVQFDGENRAGSPSRWHANIAKLSDLGFAPDWNISRGIEEFSQWSKPLLTP